MAAAEREAEVAVRVRDPNVVEARQTFEDAGYAGIVTERCAGSVADDVAAKGSLTPGRACAVLASVLDGLAAAHAAGVIHRDVKPGNVLLRHDGTVALADWGIARALFGGAGTHTTSAALLGTLPYVSPEIRQDARAATPASVAGADDPTSIIGKFTRTQTRAILRTGNPTVEVVPGTSILATYPSRCVTVWNDWYAEPHPCGPAEGAEKWYAPFATFTDTWVKLEVPASKLAEQHKLTRESKRVDLDFYDAFVETGDLAGAQAWVANPGD